MALMAWWLRVFLIQKLKKLITKYLMPKPNGFAKKRNYDSKISEI